MIIVGIDPGIHGAIATLTASDFAHVIDMPIRPATRGGKIRNEVDPLALRNELRKLVPAGESGVVVMEDLNAFIGGGKLGSTATMASLAATKAVVRTVCELARLPITHVSPKEWQAFYGIATRVESTKKQSLRIAREMFGRELCPLERHDGRADALLIARFAIRTML
ncbi:hypothetical protein [Burkholderia mayonis]|uniref:Uncharacterized protein n=1 Tax=Burkholderia mayonis TaxID=1385591 RepID=A0A1B4G377_9BURK|nr:hypothetical protein [Burkholderia mayonis]AOJ10355.1 hypothetical protein WS71_24405 [Burkholderia mayonis]KVE53663.1 hypothetical protein WS71_06365 [Burkholderia mayonis]